MKRFLITYCSLLFLVAGCKESVNQTGQECAIKLSNITFTRSLNGAASNTTIDSGTLTLRSDAKKDYFNDPDSKLTNASAPVLLTAINNKQPFTFTAKITPAFKATYDAGVLYIFSTEKLWQKFCYEQDERGRRRVVSVRTIETSDDNNHDILTQDFVYYKISSDTKTVGFYYSTDNAVWNLARLYKNDYPENIWLGISTQSPIGNGTTSLFENCTLTQTSIKDFREGL